MSRYQRPGRPVIDYNQAKAEKFISCIRLGMKISLACKASGIGVGTFRAWRIRGGDGEEPYKEFMEAVEQARGEYVMVHLQHILDRSMTDWRASAWMLERTHAKDYGDPRKVVKDLEYLMKEIDRRRQSVPSESIGAGAMYLVRQEPFLQLAAKVRDEIEDEKRQRIEVEGRVIDDSRQLADKQPQPSEESPQTSSEDAESQESDQDSD